MHTPGRGDQALRHHRVSIREACYFVTLCTKDRTGSLLLKEIATTIQAELSSIENDGHWTQRAGVLMPDHMHLLVRLSGELPIARCVARFKTKTRQVLLAHRLSWQANFYEHRLRPDDLVGDVVHYIFMNPYRTGVVREGTPYRWFWLGAADAAWFEPQTDRGRPFPEWLRSREAHAP